MKRFTAFLLCLLLCLPWGARAEERLFTDMDPSSYLYEAAAVLHNLGLMQGYDDHTFRPDDPITRAEIAAITVRCMGMEQAAKASAQWNTGFSDVPVTHWANGYIAVAKSVGVVDGNGDGTFAPDGDVLYEQSVKMLVCALGYGEDIKKVPDAYPNLYLEQAERINMTIRAKGKIGETASRGTVAMLVYNTVFAKIPQT
ncbi:S-layer homology domain-containing protein [Acetivibrio sp. MSJd-27]|uniref:S-layer homology domain-containing protein n=1 Tax=Acetivibrio sp. MSJd-27 TaxID=2841523 RepID=UPI001C0FE576|nr:S-layer homology domain-containing protein [Acetivibrio sp. MSJd-27]MBU5449343.1 S-layer homology domain-containing protein [Acetivibrio sp. MSJd-27]